MSVFLLPRLLINEIEKMLNSFWRVHNSTYSKGLDWLSSERLSVPKLFGGMGFKVIKAFNMFEKSQQKIWSPSSFSDMAQSLMIWCIFGISEFEKIISMSTLL